MHLLSARCHTVQKRIWPLCYSLCILPDEVVLSEDEEGAVDSEAVLFDRVWVVDGHCPGSLGHGLLVHPRATRSSTTSTPGPSSASARSASPSSGCASSSIAGGQIFCEASHPDPGNTAQIPPKNPSKSKLMVSVEMEGRRITTKKHTSSKNTA